VGVARSSTGDRRSTESQSLNEPQASSSDAMSEHALQRIEMAPRRGLSRVEAARYVGVSPTKFDQLVDSGRMPRPKRLDGRVIWDVRALDLAFDEIPDDAKEVDTWGDL
jgi:predicted DNA-binding transcriptional regulator AlpA